MAKKNPNLSCCSVHIYISVILLHNEFPSAKTNSLTSYTLFPIICSPSRRSPSCSWSLSAQVPARRICPVWPVCLTSPVAGARLCPAACCGTAQTSSPALRERRWKARETVCAICCWHPSTAPCVKSTETALPVLRYTTDNTSKMFFLT